MTCIVVKGNHDDLRTQGPMQQALGELRTLLERFANGMSMEVVGNAIQALYEDSKSDPELKQWFSDCDAYVRKVCPLRNPEDLAFTRDLSC